MTDCDGNTPRVSVVIPAYNVGGYICKALESALGQTVRNIEVIVVDDGSTDETLARVNEICDQRLRCIPQNQAGASAARNTGCLQARAPLIAFLDGDDFWHPRKLEHHLALMDRSPDVDLTFSLSAIVDERGRRVTISGASPGDRPSFEELLRENHIRNGSAVVVRQKAIEAAGGFDSKLSACTDYDCWLRIAALRDSNMACIPAILTYYRRRSGQLTGDWRLLRESMEQLLAKMERLSPEAARRCRPDAVRNMHRYLALVAGKAGERRCAIALLASSFRADPTGFLGDVRSWLAGGYILVRALFGVRIAQAAEGAAYKSRDLFLERRITDQAEIPEIRGPVSDTRGDRSSAGTSASASKERGGAAIPGSGRWSVGLRRDAIRTFIPRRWRRQPLDTDPITVLLPLKNQLEKYLSEAVRSILDQEDSRWNLLVVCDQETPEPLRLLLESFRDDRIRVMEQSGAGFARGLNQGLESVRTTFASILLGDDRYHPTAIGTLQRYRQKRPGADFFYSSRRIIDANGNLTGPILRVRRRVNPLAFRRNGSPVKHLLCWRVSKSLEIGGMDESLSVHGCDDYDFPWRMLEAGCHFAPVTECLYEYRVHSRERLTTLTSVDTQTYTLQSMFRKHGVPEAETTDYLQRAIDGYLLDEHDGLQPVKWETHRRRRLFCEAGAELRDAFLKAGHRGKNIFPHRAFRVERGGPDGYKLMRRLRCGKDTADLRELILYALPEAAGNLPNDVFFDRELQWHEQHCFEPYQVAWASLIAQRGRLVVLTAVSDLVQRCSGDPKHRTQIDKLFGGWPYMLWNAVADYAIDLGVSTILSPTSGLILERMIDPMRNSKAPMYERIYDASVHRMFETSQDDRWHVIDVSRNLARIVRLRKRVQPLAREKITCIVHDVERGLGHAQIDSGLASRMDGPSREALVEMLEIEEAAGVRATYSVAGCFLKEVEPRIRTGGHCVAFHSYDHRTSPAFRGLHWRLRRVLFAGRDPGSQRRQLLECRRVDARIKGYRPPQSRLEDLTNAELARRNYEWLLSSKNKLGILEPALQEGVVQIPVHMDDFSLHTGAVDYDAWEQKALGLAANSDFTVIGLHDCYGRHWLPRYKSFLEKLRSVSSLRTCDEVAGALVLDSARWV